MKVLILIVFGILVCWAATDIMADDTLRAVLAPIGLVFFVFWGLGWLLVRVFRRGGGGGGSSASLADLGDLGGADQALQHRVQHLQAQAEQE